MSLFKKAATLVKPAPTVTVAEIHESFFTEVDDLLKLASITHSEEIECPDLIEQGNRLADLGFTGNKTVREAKKELNRVADIKATNIKNEHLVEIIRYYSDKYPNYKFITMDSIKKICKKYNLIYGEVSKFIGEVPEENLKQMEQFKIADEDRLVLEINRHTMQSMGRADAITYASKYTLKSWKTLNNIEEVGASPSDDKDHYYKSTSGLQYRTPPRNEMIHAPLLIAAPIKDFNTNGMEVKNFELRNVPPPPDPIVLQPVYYKAQVNYLIVTAWGDEAGDPAVVNERHN